MPRSILIAALVLVLLAGCAPVPRLLEAPAGTVALTPVAHSVDLPQSDRVPTSTLTPVVSPGSLAGATGSHDGADVPLAALRPEVQAGLDSTTLSGMTEYSMDLQLAPDFGAVTGDAEIRYTNRESVPLDAVYLHLYPNLWDDGMTVSDVQVAGQPVSVTFVADDDIIKVPLGEPLNPGESVDVSLQFATPIPTGDSVGNYGELAYQDGILALAHFYPTVVVYDDGWHLEAPSTQGDVIYHDASLYDVTFTAPADLIAVATGATLEKADNGDGTATWRLAGGPMRDFNIAASREYRSASRQVGDTTVNSYFLPQHVAGGRDALDWAARALKTYETAFGAYPYRELDVVETPTSAGGIEYPGLIVVASRLYDASDRRVSFESATAHEVAHQWWYNVVGNDQVNHPWLDEALAQYSTYLYFRDAYGEAGAEGFEDAMKQRWARVDSAQKPIGLPVASYPGDEYSAIVYGRGPLFFLALRDQIGEEKMKEFLSRYYVGNAWGVSTPAEFQSLAEKISGQDLDKLFKEWVNP